MSFQADLTRAANKNGIALGLAGSGPWISDPAVHRLITFEDLRVLLTEGSQPAKM
jgi:hypothetical protein